MLKNLDNFNFDFNFNLAGDIFNCFIKIIWLMKKLFVLLVIVFGIGLLSQCNKNTEVVKENNDQLDLRTVSCETEDVQGYNCVIEPDVLIPVIVDVDIPGIPPGTIGDCEILAEFDVRTCQNNGYYIKIYFNFRMIIPENSDCDGLNTFLDNLEASDPYAHDDVMNALENYVAEKGKDNDMVNFVNNNGITCGGSNKTAVESKMILAGCYKRCVVIEHIDIDIGPDDRGGMKMRGDLLVRKYRSVKCGTGCCISDMYYCLNDDGSVKRSGVSFYGVGDCTPIALSIEDRLCISPHWKERGCYQRCPD